MAEEADLQNKSDYSVSEQELDSSGVGISQASIS